MNRFRCSLFTAIVLIMTSIPAFAGDIQGPGKSDPTPTPIPTALTTAPPSDGLTQPTSTDEVQIVGQDSTTLVEICSQSSDSLWAPVIALGGAGAVR